VSSLLSAEIVATVRAQGIGDRSRSQRAGHTSPIRGHSDPANRRLWASNKTTLISAIDISFKKNPITQKKTILDWGKRAA